jgi:hypothetical protein
MGLLADRLKKVQQFGAKPFGYENPPVEMLMNLLGVPAVQQTMERMAYGEPLTTGRGMTTKPRAEAVEAAMAVAPVAGLLGKATKGLPVGASIKNVGKVDELTGLPLNADGTVTVYHHTNKKAAEQIASTKKLKSAGEPDVYVTTEKEPNTGYGETVVPIRIDPQKLILDDEFPSGRMDFRIPSGKSGVPIKLEPKQTTSPRQEALDTAQRNAALPIEEGGLGLPKDNTPEMRAEAMGFDVQAYRGITGDIDKSVIPSDFFGSNYFGKGINLTSSPTDASKYASTDVGINTDLVGKAELMSERLGISYPQAKADITSGGGAVLPISANIKNPLIVGMQKIQTPDSMIRYALNESGYSGNVDKLVDQFKNANTGFEQFELMKANQATPFYRNLASLMNKDGLMIDESISPKSDGAMHYIALEPEQLRSRFAAFDPMRRNEPDLLAGVLPLGLLSDEEQRKKLYELVPTLLGQ